MIGRRIGGPAAPAGELRDVRRDGVVEAQPRPRRAGIRIVEAVKLFVIDAIRNWVSASAALRPPGAPTPWAPAWTSRPSSTIPIRDPGCALLGEEPLEDRVDRGARLVRGHPEDDRRALRRGCNSAARLDDTSRWPSAWEAPPMPVIADSEKPAPAREEVKDIVGRLMEGIKADDVSGLAAEIAYRFLFAVFPFGLFVAALGSFAARWLHVENPAQHDRRTALATTCRPRSPRASGPSWSGSSGSTSRGSSRSARWPRCGRRPAARTRS